jgi:hypothetical protein
LRCTSTKRLIIARQLAWRIRRTDTVNTSSNILVSTGLNSVLASINVNMVRLQELYLGIMSCKSMDLFKNVDHKSWLLNICFGSWTTNPGFISYRGSRRHKSNLFGVRIRDHDTIRMHGFAKRIHVFTNLLWFLHP